METRTGSGTIVSHNVPYCGRAGGDEGDGIEVVGEEGQAEEPCCGRD